MCEIVHAGVSVISRRLVRNIRVPAANQRQSTRHTVTVTCAKIVIQKMERKFTQLRYTSTHTHAGETLIDRRHKTTSLGQSVTRVKIWGGSTPKGRNVVCRKMSAWVGQYEQLKRFCLWTNVHQIFFTQRGRGCSWKILFRFAMYGSAPDIFAIKF